MCCLESTVSEEKAYKNFEERLLTFKNWTGEVNPLDLAKAGFYFTQYKDICRCVCCHIEIFRWAIDDCPINEHFKHAPYCEFANILFNCKNFKPTRTTTKETTKTVLCYRLPFLFLILILLSLTYLIPLPTFY